jgi:GNAT superfamily N-acetyltransferase
MRIRWDLLHFLITAPSVPTLGPVHPAAITAALFEDVIAIAGTDTFLPHDKDRRWADRKDQQVVVRSITQSPGLVLIPVLTIGRTSSVRVFLYAHDPRSALRQAAELCRQLCAEHHVSRGRLTWFQPPGSVPDPVAACTRIQLCSLGPDAPAAATEPGVTPLGETDTPVRATFSEFASKLAAEGFAFLDARIREHGVTGPVLTVQRDGAIVGAIGPMDIMPDPAGAARLLPQYFGVLPDYRGFGLGRSLWRAAMDWGQQHEAAYQLLQTEVGGASDRLCQSEGLTDLGTTCNFTL